MMFLLVLTYSANPENIFVLFSPVKKQQSLVTAMFGLFMANLSQLDDLFAARVAKARDEGKVLRYVGNIDEDGACRVKIAEVDGNDPLFKVKNGENALAFYSHYYQPLPLVLRGYGAGNDVTAAGVFADLLRTLSWKLGV